VRLFRVAALDQFERSLDVGEENCDLLAFAGKRGLGSQNPVSQMLGRVGERSGGGRDRGPRCLVVKVLAAAAAKPDARLIREAAVGAWHGQRRPAIAAKPPVVAIFRAAARATHLPPLLAGPSTHPTRQDCRNVGYRISVPESMTRKLRSIAG
jgi:hypothetical protein